MRLIDADALPRHGKRGGIVHWKDIENTPTIDAEPVRRGHWIKATGMMPPEFHGHHCCSECSNFANMCPPFGNREDLSDYCPNCGAKMFEDELDNLDAE